MIRLVRWWWRTPTHPRHHHPEPDPDWWWQCPSCNEETAVLHHTDRGPLCDICAQREP